MDKLPKDMINKLVDNLSARDFISFCSSNMSSNLNRICHINELWNKRFKKDFPYIIEKYPGLEDKVSKEDYLEIFRRFSKMAETFTEMVFRGYGRVGKFLSPDFKNFLYGKFYDLCTSAVRNSLAQDNQERDAVSDTYFSDKFTNFKDRYFPGMKSEDENFDNYWQEAIDGLFFEVSCQK
jgi:hypothetical protein